MCFTIVPRGSLNSPLDEQGSPFGVASRIARKCYSPRRLTGRFFPAQSLVKLVRLDFHSHQIVSWATSFDGRIDYNSELRLTKSRTSSTFANANPVTVSAAP